MKSRWIVFIAFCLLMASNKAHSVESYPDLCVRAIVGEAGGEGYQSMLAHAHAIKNRGSLRGVYGLHAHHLASESKSAWNQAKRAWNEASKEPDFTKGATSWLSDYDLKHCKRVYLKWIGDFQETVKIGHTHFYRRIK